MPLLESRRQQLDSIVQKMVSDKESDANIQIVVNDFKSKFENEIQPQVQQPKTFLDKLGDFTGLSGFGKGISQSLLFQTKEGKNLLNLLQQNKITQEEFNQAIGGGVATTKEILGSAAQIPLNIALFGGVGSAGKLAGQTLKSAGLGALLGGTKATEENKNFGDILKSSIGGAAIGAAVPLAIGGLKAGFKFAKKTVIPKLLSFTTDVPEDAIQRSINNPALAKRALQQVKVKGGDEKLLKDIQSATIGLRKSLSQEYQEGTEAIISQLTKKRFGFNEAESKLLTGLQEQFKRAGMELPQNVKNVSAKEGLVLYKDINQLLSKKAIKEGAEGIGIRKARDILKNKLIELSGGENTGIDLLLKNYTSKKSLLDNANELFNAFKSKNAKAQAQALSNLKSIYKENKGAYLNVLSDLEKETGINLLERASALHFKKILPKSISSSQPSFIKFILSPLSPRFAGFTARQVGKTSQFISKAQKSPIIDLANQLIRAGIIKGGTQ